jgi:hypothetical protein
MNATEVWAGHLANNRDEGLKRTSRIGRPMSANDPKRTLARHSHTIKVGSVRRTKMTNRNQVLVHHQPAGAMWGRGGKDYWPPAMSRRWVATPAVQRHLAIIS